MRLAAGFALAALVAGSPALADGPVSTHPLTANEVLLEVASKGSARARADRAQIVVNATGRGASDAQAATALESALERVRQAAAASGIAPMDIGAVRANSMAALMGMTGGAASAQTIEIPEDLEGEAEGSAEPVVTKNRAIQITVRDLSRLGALRSRLQALDVGSVDAHYELSENAPARQEARAAGLAQARAQAEGYAAAMGMRIVRVVRVSERISADGMGVEAYRSLMEMFLSAAGADNEYVEATVDLSIDYALAPR